MLFCLCLQHHEQHHFLYVYNIMNNIILFMFTTSWTTSFYLCWQHHEQHHFIYVYNIMNNIILFMFTFEMCFDNMVKNLMTIIFHLWINKIKPAHDEQIFQKIKFIWHLIWKIISDIALRIDITWFSHIAINIWSIEIVWAIFWKVEKQNTSYEFRYTSYGFKSTSYWFECTSYEFKSSSHEFNSTSYEFKSTSYELNFTS